MLKDPRGPRTHVFADIPTDDIAAIISRLNSSVYITQEVIYGDRQPITPAEYVQNGMRLFFADEDYDLTGPTIRRRSGIPLHSYYPGRLQQQRARSAAGSRLQG